MNYDADKDYVIDLNDIWKWLGFSQKANVKKIIDRTFIIDIDYNLTSTFICKYDCIKSLKISDKTLAKALENKSMYNNFYYRCLESRLKIC